LGFPAALAGQIHGAHLHFLVPSQTTLTVLELLLFAFWDSLFKK
jgi:hypothetical protein